MPILLTKFALAIYAITAIISGSIGWFILGPFLSTF